MEKKLIDYQIVVGSTKEGLSRKVLYLGEIGFVPIGGLAIGSAWYQAMGKFKEKTKEEKQNG